MSDGASYSERWEIMYVVCSRILFLSRSRSSVASSADHRDRHPSHHSHPPNTLL